MRSFVDKLADKTRMRRARHKGGYVPSKLKKIQVEYFDSDKEDGDDESGSKIDQPMLNSDDENDFAAAIGDQPDTPKKAQTNSAKDTE